MKTNYFSEDEKAILQLYDHDNLDVLIDNLIVASGYAGDPDKIILMDCLVDKLIDLGEEEFAKVDFTALDRVS